MGKKNDKGTIKIAGQTFKVGNKVGAGEINKIAAATGKSVSQIASKADNKGVNLSSAAQNVVSRAAMPAPQPTMPGIITGGGTDTFDGGGVFGGGGGFGGGGLGAIPEGYVSTTTLDLASQKANLDIQKQIENIRQAAQTERLKYEVDNKIPQIEAEAKGKIDIQKIINSGLQNVSRIERGADMMRSITSMFNF